MPPITPRSLRRNLLRHSRGRWERGGELHPACRARWLNEDHHTLSACLELTAWLLSFHSHPLLSSHKGAQGAAAVSGSSETREREPNTQLRRHTKVRLSHSNVANLTHQKAANSQTCNDCNDVPSAMSQELAPNERAIDRELEHECTSGERARDVEMEREREREL